MHVLFVSNGTANNDGWSTYTRTLADALKVHGHQISHATLESPIAVLTNPLALLKARRQLKQVITTKQPDVIHITVEPYALCLALLPKRYRNKTVLTVHGSYAVRLFQGTLNAVLARAVLPSISACITVSNYTKQRLLEQIALSNVTVIHNAIELPKELPKKSSATKSVICVGGIKPRKGITEALHALAHYKKQYGDNVHFTIIGSFKQDAYYEQVQNIIYAQSLTSNVTITGAVDNATLQSYFVTADALLMPAKTTPDTFEGFGLVYLEANAYGVPCIGPNDSGAAEAINNGTSGYTCDPEDPAEIAKALYAILEEGKISAANCVSWAKKHSPKMMAEAVENVYKSIA